MILSEERSKREIDGSLIILMSSAGTTNLGALLKAKLDTANSSSEQ